MIRKVLFLLLGLGLAGQAFASQLYVRYWEDKATKVSNIDLATGERIRSATVASGEIRRVGKTLLRVVRPPDPLEEVLPPHLRETPIPPEFREHYERRRREMNPPDQRPILSLPDFLATAEILLPVPLRYYQVEDISPDGGKVLLARAGAAEISEVYLYDLDTGSAKAITHHKTAACFLPRFSPDGQWVAYYFFPDAVDPNEKDIKKRDAQSERSNLWYANERYPLITDIPGYGLAVVRKDGSEQSIVAPPGNIFIGDIQAFAPKWSPDGKRIAFHNNYYDAAEATDYVPAGIYIAELSTGSYRRVSSEDRLCSCCAWLPDGLAVVTIELSYQVKPAFNVIMKVSVEGARTEVYRFERSVQLPHMRFTVAPDGKSLLFPAIRGLFEGLPRTTGVLAVLELETKELKPLVIAPESSGIRSIVDFWFQE